MSERYDAAWAAARPYMRARKNDVHVPLAFDYAQRLLEHHPEAVRDVVLLAIMLHDIGWAVVDQEAIFREGFGPNMMQSEVRIAHEREGARLAGRLLDTLGEPASLRSEVVAIIDGHDTREQALSVNDQLVKDADKLWRFSVTGVSVACDWHALTPAAYVERVEPQIDSLFTPRAKQLAREELERTRTLLCTAQLADEVSA
jgi:hypothetical protein